MGVGEEGEVSVVWGVFSGFVGVGFSEGLEFFGLGCGGLLVDNLFVWSVY